MKTVVISDGLPDSESDALAAAERMPGQIDVIFCGSENDKKGRDFMQRLARLGCGTCVFHSFAGPMALAHRVRKVLALPAPERTG